MSPSFQELNVILQKWLDGLSCLPVDMEEYPHNPHDRFCIAVDIVGTVGQISTFTFQSLPLVV